MPYIPVSYKKLRQGINEFSAYFNTISGRYIAPSYQDLRQNPDQLVTFYREKVSAKNNLFFTAAPDEKRLSQIACISELIESLPLTIEDEIKQNYAQTLILGAMLYRYLRIRDSYSGMLNYVLGGDASNSALFLSLTQLLGITPQNVLDALTIKTACEAYAAYLRQEGIASRFTYIQKDSAFLTKLDAQIAQYKKAAEELLLPLNYLNALPFKAIFFVVDDLDKSSSTAFQVLKSALLALNVTQLSLTQVKTALLSCPLEASVKNYCIYLLPQFDSIEKEKIDEFILQLEERLTIHNQYALLGVYLFAYQKIPESMPLAKRVLEQLLDISAVNVLDDKTRKLAWSAFDNLLSFEKMKSIDFGVWGSFDKLDADLTSLREGIKVEIASAHDDACSSSSLPSKHHATTPM